VTLSRFLKARFFGPAASNIKISDFIFSSNRYGVYCIPAAAAHRPAAETVMAGQVWERNTVEFMIAHCSRGDVVTAGSFFGDALPALSQATLNTVWAFEPNPHNYRCSAITTLLNDLKNVELQNAALGERSEIRQLVVRDFAGRALGGASQLVGIADQKAQRGDETVPVNVVAIDDAVPKTSHVALIQLDVEGFEEFALAGAVKTIERSRPRLVLETIPPTSSKAGQLLARLGYRITRELDAQVVLLECAQLHQGCD
jgi:FkbM family methyltransferase